MITRAFTINVHILVFWLWKNHKALHLYVLNEVCSDRQRMRAVCTRLALCALLCARVPARRRSLAHVKTWEESEETRDARLGKTEVLCIFLHDLVRLSLPLFLK